eukprot:53697-Eustigmatos_ZCMA.PRE.1
MTAHHVEADGAVLVNVTARKIKAAKGSVIYNVVDDSEVRRQLHTRGCMLRFHKNPTYVNMHAYCVCMMCIREDIIHA